MTNIITLLSPFRMPISFLIIALVFYLVSRLQRMRDPADTWKWETGQVKITGIKVGYGDSSYYGDCYTEAGMVNGFSGPYNGAKVYVGKTYDVEYHILANYQCRFRFTDPDIANAEVHGNDGKATRLISAGFLIAAAVSVFTRLR